MLKATALPALAVFVPTGIFIIGLFMAMHNIHASAERDAAREAFQANSVVVNVCRDGSRVYRMRDGRHYVHSGWPRPFEAAAGPNICETAK